MTRTTEDAVTVAMDLLNRIGDAKRKTEPLTGIVLPQEPVRLVTFDYPDYAEAHPKLCRDFARDLYRALPRERAECIHPDDTRRV